MTDCRSLLILSEPGGCVASYLTVLEDQAQSRSLQEFQKLGFSAFFLLLN